MVAYDSSGGSEDESELFSPDTDGESQVQKCGFLLKRGEHHKAWKERWFVLSCKFDHQLSPVQVLFRAFDDFFAKCSGGTGEDASQPMMGSFRQVCDRIGSTVDNEGE